MRSCGTRVAVVVLALGALSSTVGCGGGYAKADAQAPRSQGYPQSNGDRAVRTVAEYKSVVSSDGEDEAREEAPAKDSAGFDSAVPADLVAPEGSASGGGGPAPAQAPAPQAAPPPLALKAPKPDPTVEPAQNRDLVIYTARFTMAVYQVDQGLGAVEKIAKDNGGYLDQKKDREITVRIPRGRFEVTLSAVDKIGDVLHREIRAQDVTEEHVDLEIRIKNARAMQKRLADLLTRASVKDALEIEKELHRVTEELELLEGKMKVLKNKVAFSTITVAFEARGSQIQTARTRLPFPWLGALNLPSLLSLSEDK